MTIFYCGVGRLDDLRSFDRCRFHTDARAAVVGKPRILSREEREEAELAEMKKVCVVEYTTLMQYIVVVLGQLVE